MAMLQEFCTDQAHFEHPAAITEDGREICPVCTGTRRGLIGTQAKEASDGY